MERTLRATMRPSFIAPSRYSILQAPRTDERRNSSSRVQRHLTGRPVFIAAILVTGSVMTQPAEAGWGHGRGRFWRQGGRTDWLTLVHHLLHRPAQVRRWARCR